MQPKLVFHSPDRTKSPPLPHGAVELAHGAWRRRPGRESCLRRDCGGACLFVNQLPAFTSISGAEFRDLAALKHNPQQSFRPFDPFLDLWPVALDAILRFLRWLRRIGNMVFANGSEDLSAFEAELYVA